jgi:hypothetical protein
LGILARIFEDLFEDSFEKYAFFSKIYDINDKK